MCTISPRPFHRSTSRQGGVTLIELVVFIVIVGIAVSGVLLVFTRTVWGSADPQIHKQALAIAEALLEEVELQPFTFCDPDDANASTATSATVGAGACAATVEAMGSESFEVRGSATSGYDNVNDYYNWGIGPGITDITGTAINGLGGYSALVTVANDGNLGGIANTEVLLVTVTVTAPDGSTVTLDGYRSRYAPRT